MVQGLSEDERTMIFEMMDHPGWTLLSVLSDRMRKNWLDQAVNTDYTKDDDSMIVRKLLYRQGLLNGAKMMISDLNKDKRRVEQK